MTVIRLITKIKAPIEVCFDLARSIDLHKLSTEGTNEEAIGGVTTGLIGMGEEVTWEARHFGVKQRLTSKITEFKFPEYFRDQMLKGAFKKIDHRHEFEQTAAFTIMKDAFDFEVPLGLLGKAFTRLILTKYLTRLLERRNEMIKEVAEDGRWKNILPNRIQ